jgi:hypothetical protein
MILRSCKTFVATAGILALFSGLAWAGRHDFNGTWTLLPLRSTFNGEPEMTAGTVVINNFEDKISLAENFAYTNPLQQATASFSIAGRHGEKIRQGDLEARAKWDHETLEVDAAENGVPQVQRFSLLPDGTLMMTLERPGHPAVSLLFERH